MIGTSLAHYKITQKLGHGGMGEVYLAEDARLKRRVALKVLSTDVASDPDRLARFQREAETVAGLNHPNIVTLYSVESEEDIHFITMELIEGRTLDEVIPADGLSLEKVFEFAIPFADALAAAHEKGIIHRDLKPANVMVTEEGRIKVLDFGLAKPTDDAAGDQEATQLLTEEGKILGTVPYMAPEQVQGKQLDRRSDIFSLGVMLYEMATGSRPFRGETSADLISSILRDEPAPVTEVKMELPHHLGRIVRHCLEKNPKRRYQSALDVRNELEDLRKEVESGVISSESTIRQHSAITTPVPSSPETSQMEPVARNSWWRWALGAAAIVGLVFLTLTFLDSNRGAEREGPQTASSAAASASVQPSIAVMFFDNLSGDPELDWLRNGLTDMLVTDLSQSPDLRVLSTNRVYQILSDMKKLDERITSFEVVREVAEQAAADTVILGSFAKLGETIRISIKIQEAATGEILKADSVDARAQEDIFARIDDLSRNIRQSIELPEAPAAVADRDLAEVSTQSVEAYRHYVEAERLHYESRDFEAIPFYKKAVEADPTFAMAWAKLSTAHGNTGQPSESQKYAEKAIEHLERLTEPERAYVEGRYYAQSMETKAQAIETYSSTLAKYPHLTSLANNLAVQYTGVWLYDEAIASFEQGIAYGDEFPGTYHGLAGAYAAVGDMERAVATLEGFLEKTPASFSTYLTLAGLRMTEGDLVAAEEAIAKANELNPGYFQTAFVQYSFDVLESDWAGAQASIDQLAALPFPFARSAANGLKINLLFYQGRYEEARPLIDASLDAWPGPSPSRGQVHLQIAVGYTLNEEYELALEHAKAARDEDRGNNSDFVAHGLEVLANQGLGRTRRADLLFQELERRVESIPGEVMKFWLREVRGRLAVARGDLAAGIEDLKAAAASLPNLDGNSTRVWFALGEALLAAGEAGEAEKWFRKIAELEGARAFTPTDYVRSQHRLGRILEQRGDLAAARKHYRNFVDFWGDGDMDREEMAEARAFLAGG